MVSVKLVPKMSIKRYTSEETYRILSMTYESKGASLSKSGSEYEPVESSTTLTDSLDDGEKVPVKTGISDIGAILSRQRGQRRVIKRVDVAMNEQ